MTLNEADSLLFDKVSGRLRYLELWRELAIRPLRNECEARDLPLLDSAHDDCDELTRRCIEARQQMNGNLPPHEVSLDHDLEADESSIRNAGYGLYYRPKSKQLNISTGQIICYYCGHIHNFLSAKTVRDKSYLMLVSGDILVDPGPLRQIKARYINDPLIPERTNCVYEPQPKHFRSAVIASRDIIPGEELFSSYGDAYWAQQTIVGSVYRG